MKRDGVSHDVSMCPCTNPLILIMGISLLPVARSLLPFNSLYWFNLHKIVAKSSHFLIFGIAAVYCFVTSDRTLELLAYLVN
ncbi:MAG: hypothetical protein V7K67_19115 [Nostoc sp.]|uniref:hypothetical protein n=1 Tax=Nostoc sp. TaxID=1180 RepID=UPI002FF89B99